MGILKGLPKVYKDSKYADIKSWFDKTIKPKCPDVDFDKEWTKIGGKLPDKKSEKK